MIYAKGHCPGRRCLHSERIARERDVEEKESRRSEFDGEGGDERERLFIVTHNGIERNNRGLLFV